MASLTQILGSLVGQAFALCGAPSAMGAVRVSDRPDLAPFQCNGAMAVAKQAGRPPRPLAEEICGVLSAMPAFSRCEVAGPGFINLDVCDDFLSDYLIRADADPRLGAPLLSDGAVLMLDYGGPNLAKPMHVGHLRSSIIGDTLRRMAVFAGYRAIGDIHMGDWGLQMGQVISELERRHPDWPYFNPDFKGAYPPESPISMADLDEIYPAASKACKADEARMEEARKAALMLMQGRAGYRAMWRHILDVSVESMKRNFEALNVAFDLWRGESDVQDLIAPMVERLRAANWACESEGAIVVPVARNDDKKEVPPLILLKRDGAALYGSTDLATLVDRMAEFSPVAIVYVVDQRQSLHFEQVFRAARLGGIVPESVALTFAGFGTMNGRDGKPFKTREGGVVRLEDLITMAVEKAAQRLDEADLARDMDAAGRAEIARMVAVAAIKFADLQNQRQSDYIFDMDRMVAFEGRTGPYLLYQAVRITSLLRKAALQGVAEAPPDAPLVLHAEDKALALLLTEWPDVFEAAFTQYVPHAMCDYAYRLAQGFSAFYAACHILSEADPVLQASRLRLARMTLARLERILSLLGLEIPPRM